MTFSLAVRFETAVLGRNRVKGRSRACQQAGLLLQQCRNAVSAFGGSNVAECQVKPTASAKDGPTEPDRTELDSCKAATVTKALPEPPVLCACTVSFAVEEGLSAGRCDCTIYPMSSLQY